MADLRSALLGHLRPGRFGAGEPSVVLSERPLGTFVQLAGWPDSFEDAATSILQRLGFEDIGGFGLAQLVGSAASFRVAPERLLLRLASRDAWEQVRPTIDPSLTPWLDLSHSRIVIRLSGPGAAELLARGLPIDLHDDVFAPGRFAQSAIHTIAVLVHRLTDQTFEVYVPQSFALAIWEFLTGSAAPLGYRVEGPQAYGTEIA